ncbi:Ubiquitin--protein ligase [Handroanthus impetiginosus]|uniref:RBR-type E3 ubiquitin transferase n=1 Tax=Handroanthus impetiginosus TaxID=429701 RepID=A0A2G9GD84_9LAMI|nr:Ubiquitin--protein ligase [Handroanthus impetiginosus]
MQNCISRPKGHTMKVNLTPLANVMRRLFEKLTHARRTPSQRKDKKIMVAHESSQSRGDRNEKKKKKKKKTTMTCEICLVETDVDQMFRVLNCKHRFCKLCMSKHVNYRLRDGFLPKCPRLKCKTKLEPDEDSIPVKDKIYCPNPRCSALFSRQELQGWKWILSGARKNCPKCGGNFCIKCKVPWHENMTCKEYKRQNPHTSLEEEELHCLATTHQWRQCSKCNSMISLRDGCNHIRCRFCKLCMSKHVNYRLRDGFLPKCPRLKCKTKLEPDVYKEFLSP